MRIQVIVPALSLVALALAGCSTSPSAEGVLPRTDVPPPPSIERSAPSRQNTATASGTAAQQRRGLSVPDRLVPPRPAVTR